MTWRVTCLINDITWLAWFSPESLETWRLRLEKNGLVYEECSVSFFCQPPLNLLVQLQTLVLLLLWKSAPWLDSILIGHVFHFNKTRWRLPFQVGSLVIRIGFLSLIYSSHNVAESAPYCVAILPIYTHLSLLRIFIWSEEKLETRKQNIPICLCNLY